MPGIYLEYIQAGRYVVPVEISILSVTYTDTGNREKTSSKWTERHHWKEIKAMLKPAVELATKYNETGAEKISKSHHISSGSEISIGYMIHVNKDKSPFIAILDSKKHIWSDDESEMEIDENTDLANLGGKHRNFTPTKCYIKACVIKKSDSKIEDERKIRKELGVKSDDVRSYFQPSNASDSTSTVTVSDDLEPGPGRSPEKGIFHGSDEQNERVERNTIRGIEHRSSSCSPDSSETEEELMDLPHPNSICSRTEAQYLHSVSYITDPYHVYEETSRSPEKQIAADKFKPSHSEDVESFFESDEEEEDYRSGRNILPLEYSNEEGPAASRLFRNWDSVVEECDEQLLDIDDVYRSPTPLSIPTPPKRRKVNRKVVRRTKKKSISDHSSFNFGDIDTGLPDIGEVSKGARGKSKKKRNVAVVEPMRALINGLSFEELLSSGSPVTEKKRKARTASSPTIDRHKWGFKNSAIEILSQDSDLLTIPGEIKKPKDSPAKKRGKKRDEVQVPLSPQPYERMTPELMSELEDEEERTYTNLYSDPNPDSSVEDSDSEMPVLVKMVSTLMSDEEEKNENVDEASDDLACVPPLEPETVLNENTENSTALQGDDPSINKFLSVVSTNESVVPKRKQTFDSITENEENLNEQASHVSLHKKKKRKRRKEKAVQETSLIHQDNSDTNSQTNSEFRNKRKDSHRRAKYASDSDDITSEAAYRKTPFKKKKRKKVSFEIPEKSMIPVGTNTEIETVQKENELSSQIQDTHIVEGQIQNNIQSVRTVPENELVPFLDEQENDVERVETKAICKTEENIENLPYDIDFISRQFSDDDDDVLFDGVFCPTNLHLPALGSPEEEEIDESELFSFDNPIPIFSNHSSSNNEVAISPNQMQMISTVDHVEQVSYSEEPDYCFDLASPSTSKSLTHMRGDPNVLQAFQLSHTSEPEDHDRDINESAPNSMLESYSTEQLLSHPSVLKAGIGLFSKLTNKSMNIDEFGKRSGLNDKSEEHVTTDRERMPPPLSPIRRRPVSPDICSLNPEERRRRPRLQRMTSNNGRVRSPEPYTPPNSESSQLPGTGEEGYDSTDEAIGEPLLRELMTRLSNSSPISGSIDYHPNGDEFDLSQRSHVFLDVFPDYALKSRYYKIHSKKINELTVTELHEEFDRIKPEVQGIFEGRIPNDRNMLYCSKDQRDKQLLRALNLTSHRTFSSYQGRILSNLLFEFLLPQPGSRLKYADYINYVMLPEAYIRIYTNVNGVSRECAENELRYGACYGGPLML